MQFTLRSWKPDDLDSLVLYGNNPHIAQYLTDKFPNPYTPEKAKAFIAHNTKEKTPNVLAIDVEGEAVGAIGIHPQSDIECKNAEMGYWLAEPFWGKGIMSEAIQHMVNYGFQHWDINRIFARPFGTNIGSQRALEKAGFVLEARFSKTFFKKGEYLDELVYAVRKEPFE